MYGSPDGARYRAPYTVLITDMIRMVIMNMIEMIRMDIMNMVEMIGIIIMNMVEMIRIIIMNMIEMIKNRNDHPNEERWKPPIEISLVTHALLFHLFTPESSEKHLTVVSKYLDIPCCDCEPKSCYTK